jgi:hypothetical protein
MAARAPLDLEAFAGVSGVGGYKRDRYGEVFLKAIKDYLEGITDKTELNSNTHFVGRVAVENNGKAEKTNPEHVEPERPVKTDPAPADTWQDPSGNRQEINSQKGLPQRAHALWTEMEDNDLRKHHLEGRSVRQMAVDFARRPGAIRSRLTKLKLI